MTGYGQASLDKPEYIITWEIKSVNSRFLDFIFKIPYFVHSEQLHWEKIVRSYALRGRIELYLKISIKDENLVNTCFEAAQAQKMIQELQEFAHHLNLEFQPDLNRFFLVAQLWKNQEQELPLQFKADLNLCLEKALQTWDKSREEEGKRLQETIFTYLQQIQKDLAQLEKAIKDNVQSKFAKLKTRIQAILGEIKHNCEEPLLAELALMADKLDVSEEIARLYSHLRSIEELIPLSGIGKKLDFYLQECFREINTCTNKAQNVAVSQLGVNIKSNLEKLREQAQNLE